MLSVPFSAAATLRIPISSQAIAQLRALDGEDFKKVIKVAEKKLLQVGLSPRLSSDEAEASLRQYYAMPIIFPEKKEMAVSSMVDPYWHTHLLDTKGYRSFCERVYGHFMDHVPLDQDDKVDLKRVTGLYLETRALMEKAFGDSVCEKAFPTQPTSDIVICTYEYDGPVSLH